MEKKYNEAIFSIEESAAYPKKYKLVFNPAKFRTTSTTGSYLVMGARVLGISYPSFLRLCRDSFDAELYGKNTLYPLVVFPDKLKANLLCRTLNAFANDIMYEVDQAEYNLQQELQNMVDNEG